MFTATYKLIRTIRGVMNAKCNYENEAAAAAVGVAFEWTRVCTTSFRGAQVNIVDIRNFEGNVVMFSTP